MRKIVSDWLLAFCGGAILALMIRCNSMLAKYSTPFVSSWVAHGVGSVASLFLVTACFSVFKKANHQSLAFANQSRPSLLAYLGGIPGAFTVVLASFTVNTALGLSGTIVFMLFGQVVFGLLVDTFGLFGIPKRRLVWTDLWVILLILSGSWIVIIFR